MPRIAIDYTAAYEQGGGIGRYVRELTAALAQYDQASDYRLFVSGVNTTSLPPAPGANFAWKPTSITPRALARLWHRARLPLPVELFTGRVDLFHATDFALPPCLPRTRTLLTVHDLSFVRLPAAADPGLRRYLDRVVPRSVARADHVLADSGATKDDLIDCYATPEDKISVLYCGVDAHFAPVRDENVLDSYNLRGVDYLLSVGTLQPRKNYSRVIKALAILRDRGLDRHYAIAGGKGWMEAEITDAIAQSDMRERVHLLGFVADSHLPALYSGSRALINVSLYEGFGLPLLEAMACGAPVITSDRSSLPEVAGDAALQVDPLDIEAIARAIERLERDNALRADLVRRGRERVKQFTWRGTAEQLKAIYDELLAR